MVMGLLGSALTGAAGGAAEADIKNTATQNEQTMKENLQQQESGINNMYAMRMQEYQMNLTVAMRQKTQAAVQPILNKMLASAGLVAPGSPVEPGQKVADPDTYAKYQANAYAAAGIVPGEEVYKGGTGVMEQTERGVAQIKSAGLLAQGRASQGIGAAAIHANSEENVAFMNNSTKSQIAAQNALRDPLFGNMHPADQQTIRDIAGGKATPSSNTVDWNDLGKTSAAPAITDVPNLLQQ